MPEQKLSEGSIAPDFKLESDDGKSYSLSEFRGKKNVVLYFYPKDDTPGCTKEACSFRDNVSEFVQRNVQILGVSLDNIASHSKFKEKYDLNFPLLSDPDHKVSRAYGVYRLKKIYGNEFWGIERSTFVIDKSGKIKKVFPHVSVNGHINEVLKSL